MRFTVKAKLVGSFILIIMFTAVVGLVGLNTSSTLNNSLQDVTRNWMPKGELIKETSYTVANYRIWEVANVLAAQTNDQKAMAEYKTKLAAEQQTFTEQMDKLSGMLVTEKGKTMYADLQNKWQKYTVVAGNVQNLIAQNRALEAFQIMRTSSRDAYGDVTASLNDLTKVNSENAKKLETDNDAAYSRARAINIAVVISAVIIGLAAGLILALSISNGVGMVTAAAVKMAAGDLTIDQLKVKSKDEIGDMAKAVNTMIINLRDLVTKVSSSAQEVVTTSEELSATAEEASSSTQQVAKAVDEVAKGTSDQTRSVTEAVEIVGQLTTAVEQIATGAQQQSGSVNETNQIVSQMVSVIQEVASSAQAVSQSAENTSKAATAGGEAVVQTVEGMKRIKDKVFEAAQKIKELGDQSSQIGEIIQVIDDIAEQTNLLALNAAIEAARAGEHGKGFAVVADEVRKLAERSGKATKEIADLITGIQRGTSQAVNAMEQGTQEVEAGSELAQNAGSALNEIIENVDDTYKQTQSISSAAQQMAASSNQVVKAIDLVAEVTETNTAATQEMSASSGQVADTMQNIAAVSEENSAAIEEVSASTEQITASSEQISASAEALSRMAVELQEIIAKFKV